MSTSKSGKARRKLARQGKLAADRLRVGWQGVNPVTKKTPTLMEKQTKLHNKHRRNHAYESDDSFCVYTGRGAGTAA
ncbi:hypothetical protein [Paenibacillus arenilitoris]|uniref:Uncharacterized protein n=1 Tax=Paenibacillus arenilitoris TaxID=2772299 RepID=A0A927CH98_9BACL|nr:hypothetical protein [Paenibacillus arenilitoris]MBD2867510.1 hypothetical protein [Paenibacillus arenilitoris]